MEILLGDVAPICIALTVDLVPPTIVVGYMEITCVQVMEEVMAICMEVPECMVGRCITAGWEGPMVVMVWALVPTIRVQMRLALQHHPLFFGCPSYE
uniref:Uncharacterized protein n=1 Tax=Arundo donax TaxID=35708 RepID=A0A0A9DEJ7_ARUDO